MAILVLAGIGVRGETPSSLALDEAVVLSVSRCNVAAFSKVNARPFVQKNFWIL